MCENCPPPSGSVPTVVRFTLASNWHETSNGDSGPLLSSMTRTVESFGPVPSVNDKPGPPRNIHAWSLKFDAKLNSAP